MKVTKLDIGIKLDFKHPIKEELGMTLYITNQNDLDSYIKNYKEVLNKLLEIKL